MHSSKGTITFLFVLFDILLPTESFYIQDCSLDDNYCLYTNGSTTPNVTGGENICSTDGGVLLNLFIDGKDRNLYESTKVFIRSYRETKNKSVLYRNFSYQLNDKSNCSYYDDKSRQWRIDLCSDGTQFLVVCLRKKCNFQWEMYTDKWSMFNYRFAILPLDKCKIFCELESSICGGISWREGYNSCELSDYKIFYMLRFEYEPGCNTYQVLRGKDICHNLTDVYIKDGDVGNDDPLAQNAFRHDVLVVGLVLGLLLLLLLIVISVLAFKFNKLRKSAVPTEDVNLKPKGGMRSGMRTNETPNQYVDDDHEEPTNYEALHF